MKRRFLAALGAATCLTLLFEGAAVAQSGHLGRTAVKPVGTIDVSRADQIGDPVPHPTGERTGIPDVHKSKGIGTPPPRKPAPPREGPVIEIGTHPTDKIPGVTPRESNGSDWILDIVKKHIVLSPNDPVWPPVPPNTPPNVFGIGSTRTLGIHDGDEPAPPPNEEDHNVWVDYLKVDPTTHEEVNLRITLDGRLTYHHHLGDFGVGPDVPWSVDRADRVDPTTVVFAFGVLSASGFMDFPDEFPPGGSHKQDFDTWVTLHEASDVKTVFAPGTAMVPKDFDTLRDIFDTVAVTLENQPIFVFDAWDGETGSYAGGITVEADGDATIRMPAVPGDLDLRTHSRTLSAERMTSLRMVLDTSSFFQMPACSDAGGGSGLEHPFQFRMTYRANEKDYTIHFDSESSTAATLSVLVDWLLDAIS